MKRITQSDVITITKYQAVDGTIFDDEKECEKYEKSAKGVLNAKYRDLVVSSSDEDDLFSGFGSSDSTIDIVRLKLRDDIDTLMQMFMLENPHMTDDENRERVTKIRIMLQEAIADHSYVLVHRGYDNENFWIVTHIKKVIEKLNEFADENNIEL